MGHNVAYDLAVICAAEPDLCPAVFAAYKADRITDTKLRQQLLDIAGGVFRGRPGEKGRWIKFTYDLEAVSRRMAGIKIEKDAWRMSYGNFIGLPIESWEPKARELQRIASEMLAANDNALTSEERAQLEELATSQASRCTEYPKADAAATLAVYLAQEKHRHYLFDQFRQGRGAWALHLSSAWGIRTDPFGVEVLKRETAAELAELEAWLIEAGLVRQNGTRDTKAATTRMVSVCREKNIPIRRTDSHTEACAIDGDCHVCLDSDACKATEDDVLEGYAELSTLKKVLTNDCEALALGVVYPIHTRYDLAETGRTTSSKPNIQNVRRRPGIRECFVPRPHYVFAQADFPQLELYTLAQYCWARLGFSKLAKLLNDGLDPHLAVAAQILGISYEEAAANKTRPDVDNARQTAKVANFGFPGGLGFKNLVLFAKKTYGVILSIDDAKRLKDTWFNTLPEMELFFAHINEICNTSDGTGVLESLYTKRYRGGARYCALCNSCFQGLGSDCAKNAAWLIAHAQYNEPDSPLFDTRTVAFVHDEFIIEVRDDERAHDAAHALADKMIEGANVYLPDVPIKKSKMDPLLMRRWSKKAKPVSDAKGRLVPWQQAA